MNNKPNYGKVTSKQHFTGLRYKGKPTQVRAADQLEKETPTRRR